MSSENIDQRCGANIAATEPEYDLGKINNQHLKKVLSERAPYQTRNGFLFKALFQGGHKDYSEHTDNGWSKSSDVHMDYSNHTDYRHYQEYSEHSDYDDSHSDYSDSYSERH